jgi:hypothetical protein
VENGPVMVVNALGETQAPRARDADPDVALVICGA